MATRAFVNEKFTLNDTLLELNDTNITSPADGGLLIYDTATGMWRDSIMSGHATISDTGAITVATLNQNTTGTAATVTGAAQANITSLGTLTTLTVAGEVDAISLDISGNADIDGTLEADAITVDGTALNTVIASVTVTNATSAVTAANATNANNIQIADESTDTTCFPVFVTGDSSYLAPKVGSNLTFNSSSGLLTATTFVGALTGNVTGNVSGSSGSTTGNAATATVLATARTIGGVSFDGSANINLPGVNAAGNQNTSGLAATATLAASATVLTTARAIGGVNFDGSAAINLSGVNAAGNQNTSGTAANLSGTPNISVGTIGSGNITTTGYLRGPASFVIDPATHGDDTGTLVIAGNLQVDGTTTTINSTTVAIDDLNFSIATDAADSAAANGAGITIGGASATLLYTHATTSWDMNKPLNVTGNIGVSGTVDGIDIAARDSVLTSTTTTAGAALPKAGGAMTGAITTNSTFDGIDIATRDAILTSTTTTAGAALPKAGGTMTGELTGKGATFSPNTAGKGTFTLTTNASDDGRLLIKSNTTTKVDIQANGDTYFNGGDVGIGNTSPDSPLDVRKNDSATTPVLTLRQLGSGDASINFQTTTSPYGFNLGVDGSDSDAFKIAVGLGDVGTDTALKIDTSKNATFAGDIIASGGAVHILSNQITSGWNADSEDSDIWINYRGYAGGTTRFRDFRVGDGKQNQIAVFDGSTKRIGIGQARGGTVPRASLDVSGENSGYDGTIRIGERTIIEARDAGQTTTSIVNTYNHDSAKFNIRLKDVADSAAQLTVLGSGNVGIGTATPAALLDVGGGVVVDPTIRIDSASGGNPTLIFDASQANRGAGIKFYDNGSSTGGFIDYVHNGDKMNFGSGSSVNATMTVGDQKVGIGTTSPDYKLEVESTTDADLVSIKSTAIANNTQMRLGISGNDSVISATGGSTGALAFKTYGTERMRITSAGNVGIGIADPDQKLEIGAAGKLKLSRADNARSMLLYTDNSYGTIETDTDPMLIKSAHRISFSLAGSEKIRFDQFGKIGLGLGSSNPSALLHINGSGDAIRVESTNIGAGGAQIDLLHFTTSPADNDTFALINMGGYYTGTTSVYGTSIKSIWTDVSARDAALTFSTNNSGTLAERMRVTSYGQLLIGATSSGYGSNLYGYNLGVMGNASQSFMSMNYGGGALDTQGMIFGLDASGGVWLHRENKALRLYTNNSERMRVTGAGNVGIGTTAAASKVHILGGSSNTVSQANAILNIEGAGGNGVVIGNMVASTYGSYLQAGYVDNFATATYPLFLNPSGGSVGIGTTSAGAKFQVGAYTFSGGNGVHADSRLGIMNNGNLTSIVNASTYNDANHPEYGLVFIQGPTTSSYNVWSISPDGPAKGDSLSFIYGAQATNIHGTTPKVVFDGNGNVGIGPSSKTWVPASKLHVRVATDANFEVETASGILRLSAINDSRAANSPMQLAASRFNFLTGNVGIGLAVGTTPSGKLHVRGTGTYNSLPSETIASDVIITSSEMTDSAYHSILQLVSVRQSLSTGSSAQGFLGFSTVDDSNGQGMRDAARIAIVNESPAARNSSTALGFWTNPGGVNATVAPTEKMRISSAGNVGIGTDSPTTTLSVKGTSSNGINIIGVGTTATRCYFGLNASNHGYLSVTGSSGQSPSLINSAGGDSYISGGNVGIGTTGPAAKLQVGTNPDPSQTAESLVHLLSSTASSTVNGFAHLKLDYHGGVTQYDPGATIMFNQSYHSGNLDYTQPTGAIRGYRTTPTQYGYGGGVQLLYQPSTPLGILPGLSLDHVGNVGIGNTAPTAKLTIDNSISTTYSTTGYAATPANSMLYLNNTHGGSNTASLINFRAGSGDGVLGFVEGGGTNDADFIIQTDGGSNGIERFRILNNGNVGIGVTPSYKLDVRGASAVSMIRTPDTTSPTLGLFVNDGSNGVGTISVDDGGHMTFDTGSTGAGQAERMRIMANGNVGIGATSTSCTLKVQDTKTGSASDPHFCLTGNGYSSVQWLDATAYYITQGSGSRDIRIVSSNNGVKLTPGATSWASNSDISLKENLKPLENVLDKIKDYRCVKYNLKNTPEDKKIGFIAQDWKKDFPDVITKDENDLLGLKYTETIPVLLKAIQELEARVKELENK